MSDQSKKDAAPTDALYVFPPAPDSEVSEWPGTSLGLSNTLTRTKGRTAVHDKTVDATPGLRDRLVARAQEYMRPGKGRSFTHDVIIHGIRVRAHTNSPHLADFWVTNWYSPEEWKRESGLEPMAEPQIQVYAFGRVKEEQEAAYYSRKTNTIAFFNTSYYGQLKSWVLGAVGRILASEHGVHSIHGACVGGGDHGVLYIAPTGTGKSTCSYGLMGTPTTRFHSDDWVYVRYTYKVKDGRRVSPIHVKGSRGGEAQGFRIYRWLENNSSDVRAQVTVRTLEDKEFTLPLSEIDLNAPIEAYAYTSEKIFYLRTNLAESFPESAYPILQSALENVPDVTDAFIEKRKGSIAGMIAAILASKDPAVASLFGTRSQREREQIAGRLIAFDNARAMLDITKVFPRTAVYVNPMEPVHLTSIILIKRDFNDPLVLETLPLEKFMSRLLIGETPMKTREVAYNAYRAVDDKTERAFLTAIEGEFVTRKSRGGKLQYLYEVFREKSTLPESLEEEFELFRVMHRAAACYDLNTVLQNDPTVRDRREAVRRTIDIIARVIEAPHPDLHLTLQDYRRFLA